MRRRSCQLYQAAFRLKTSNEIFQRQKRWNTVEILLTLRCSNGQIFIRSS